MKKSFFLIILAFLSIPHGGLKAQDIVLENEILKAVFDGKNASIKYVLNKSTGWEIHRRPELAQSFYMNIPMEEQRYNPVLGNKQEGMITSFDQEKQKLTFTWNVLKSEKGGKLDIQFAGHVHLGDQGLVFTAEIVNNSELTVETIRWPQLGDLNLPKGTKKFTQSGIMYGGMQELEMYPKFENNPGYFAVDNPAQWMEFPYTPFALLSNEKEGLYVGYHDTSTEDKLVFKSELKPGYVSYELWDTGVNPKMDSIAGEAVHYEFSTIHFPFVGPGDSKILKPVVIQPYMGNWTAGADLYMDWRSEWFVPPHKPAWLKEVNSWQQIHLNNPVDDIRYNYKDLLEIGKDCARNGVRGLQVTGWTLGGQDEANPSHDTDPRLGTWGELKNVIAEIQKLGVKVVLFTKFTWADRTQEWYKKELIKHTTKDPYGEPHYYNGYAYQTDVQLAEINTRHFSPLCHLSKVWRKIAGEEFLKTIELGADGMLFDENQHHGGASYCFDPNHGHPVPAHIFKGDEVLGAYFDSIRNELNPEYIFAGEGHYDLENRHYLVSYFRADLNHIPMHRYVAPFEEMMIAVSGYNDRNMINSALLYRYIISYEPRNFKGRLNEFPKTLEYGKKIDAMRQKYSNFLWYGRFDHTKGVSVSADGEDYDKYAVFLDVRTGKKGVVVANFDYVKKIVIEVDEAYSKSRLLLATPESPDEEEYQGALEIPPNSTIFIYEE